MWFKFMLSLQMWKVWWIIGIPVYRQCYAACVTADRRRSSYADSIVLSSRATRPAAATRHCCRRPATDSVSQSAARAAEPCRWARSRRGSRRPCGRAPWPPGRPRARCAATSATRGPPTTSDGCATPVRTARSDARRSRDGCRAATGLGTSLHSQTHRHPNHTRSYRQRLRNNYNISVLGQRRVCPSWHQ